MSLLSRPLPWQLSWDVPKNVGFFKPWSFRVQRTWLYCGSVPAANALGCTAAEGLLYKPWYFSRSYLHRQVSPPETLVVKGETTEARNGRWILPENARLPRNIQGSFKFRKSTTWDKRLYFPSEGRRAEDFFALKNPTASAGFEQGTW